MTFEPEML